VPTAAEKCIDAAGRRNPAGAQSELHWALTNENGLWHFGDITRQSRHVRFRG